MIKLKFTLRRSVSSPKQPLYIPASSMEASRRFNANSDAAVSLPSQAPVQSASECKILAELHEASKRLLLTLESVPETASQLDKDLLKSLQDQSHMLTATNALLKQVHDALEESEIHSEAETYSEADLDEYMDTPMDIDTDDEPDDVICSEDEPPLQLLEDPYEMLDKHLSELAALHRLHLNGMYSEPTHDPANRL
jgi:hypothetical protein